MVYKNRLSALQKELMRHYRSYKKGNITEQEYLIKIRPIDLAIGELEMAILRDTLALKASFLPHTLKLKR